MYSWPNARISVMGGEQAASVLSQVGNLEEGPEMEKFKEEIRTRSARVRCAATSPLCRYDNEGSPFFASARLWDDGVIMPSDTRRVVGLSLSAALNAPIPETKFGVFRM